MNIDNIKLAIKLMERVEQHEKNLDRSLIRMSDFQRNIKQYGFYETEAEVINHCGTACCFSGWIAVAPEFQALGVKQGPHGEAMFGRHAGAVSSLAKLFGVGRQKVDDLIYDMDITTPREIIERLESWLK